MKKRAVLFTCLLLGLSGIRFGSLPVAAQTMAPVQLAEAEAVPEQAQTMYGIGSVSKVFTAAAAMKLVEEGMLDLDEPLTTYIPDFTMADPRYREITPRMLLNHSAGLMGMTDNNAWLMGDNDTYNHDHFLELLQTQTLKHDPGAISIYCNDGLTLAEILIERVSGVSFTEFIAQNFLQKLGLEQIKTTQSAFDRDTLAAVYIGSNEMKAENLNVIGSGGMYASMEDLCKYATIFMDGADGSVLSKASVEEMAQNQHQRPMVDENADTTFSYGLGWDSVDVYPFNQYGIKALAKGGGTGMYHTNLTVLPEQNLAVAVASSGQDTYEQQIAQEIIMEVLKEEGLIDNTELTLPELNTESATIPESTKAYAGLYDFGQGYFVRAEFTESTLLLTPIGVRNERTQEYIYNTAGEFVSTNGDYIGIGTLSSTQDGTRGVTTLQFADDQYIVIQTYETAPGLSQTACAMPVAVKVEPNAVSGEVMKEWESRNDKEYLLTNEKYSSFQYVRSGIAKINTDERTPGYVGVGIYQSSGANVKSARIMDANTAAPYQSTPTMTGRDTNLLRVEKEGGVETLYINHYAYIDASTIEKTSQIGDEVKIASGAVWYDVDESTAGQSWQIKVPENGSWFAYDDKMNCIATSLEKDPRDGITLPINGRIVFVGEAGAAFSIAK